MPPSIFTFAVISAGFGPHRTNDPFGFHACGRQRVKSERILKKNLFKTANFELDRGELIN